VNFTSPSTRSQILHREHPLPAFYRLFGNAHQGANMSSPVFAFIVVLSGFVAYLALILEVVK
jgi:hypothetical protein